MFWPTTSSPRRAAMSPVYAVLRVPKVLTIASQPLVEESSVDVSAAREPLGVVGAGIRNKRRERFLGRPHRGAEKSLVDVTQLLDLPGDLGHRAEVTREDLAPGTIGGVGGQFAKCRVLTRAPLLGQGCDLDYAGEPCGTQTVHHLFDLPGGVREPARLSGGEQQLLLLELEQQEFEQLAFPPEQCRHIVGAHLSSRSQVVSGVGSGWRTSVLLPSEQRPGPR